MNFSLFRPRVKFADASKANAVPNPSVPSGAEAHFLQGLEFARETEAARDYAQAAQCYALAAEQNHSLAQLNLAMLYRHGQGVPRDQTKSLMWLTRAAKLGNAAAQYELGVQRHLACRAAQPAQAAEGRIEALKWVRLSASQGYREAKSACEFVALKMTADEVNETLRRVAAFVPGQI